MDEQYVDDVYDALRGIRIQAERVDGVENLFIPGSKCDRLYTRMLDAYDRLLTRLGAVDEDPDVEIIISSLMGIEGEISRKMYFYGARFGIE